MRKPIINKIYAKKNNSKKVSEIPEMQDQPAISLKTSLISKF